MAHIGAHLQTGLAGWLFGTLGKAGIILPGKLNLAGIFSLMGQILGVTWQAIRAQVVKRVGPMAEKVMDQVEKSITWVGALITKGPIALMEMAKEFLGELLGGLETLFFDAFVGWIRNTIIFKAVQKLISMFNPVGAIIQAVITIYNMIQFFIERAKQIAALVNAIFSSIAEITGGNLKKAIAAVEDSLVKALPVAISFLANLVGIGGIAAKIKEIIQKIRGPIDKAVAKVVGFIVGKAKAFIARISGAEKPKEEAPKNQSEEHNRYTQGQIFEQSGINCRRLNYKPSSGVELVTTPGKTTTILGTYGKVTGAIISELGNIKSTDLGPRPNGFNVLNVPIPGEYNAKQFWNDFNEPWLDSAIKRNDIILLATMPEFKVGSLFRKNSLGKLELSGFGKEYSHLRKNGYIFDSNTKRMIKK